MRTMSHQRYQSRDRNIPIIKRNQMEILQPRSTISEMKNSLEGLNHVFELSEERISKFRDRWIEIMQSEEERGKKGRKEQSLRDVWNTIKSTNPHINSRTRRRFWERDEQYWRTNGLKLAFKFSWKALVYTSKKFSEI